MQTASWAMSVSTEPWVPRGHRREKVKGREAACALSACDRHRGQAGRVQLFGEPAALLGAETAHPVEPCVRAVGAGAVRQRVSAPTGHPLLGVTILPPLRTTPVVRGECDPTGLDGGASLAGPPPLDVGAVAFLGEHWLSVGKEQHSQDVLGPGGSTPDARFGQQHISDSGMWGSQAGMPSARWLFSPQP